MRQTILLTFSNKIRSHIISALLLQHPKYQIIGLCETCETAEDFITTQMPDIAILDEGLEEICGLKLAKTLQDIHSRTKVVILTPNNDKMRLRMALEYGVWGYFSYHKLSKNVLTCLDTISMNKHYIDTEMFKLKVPVKKERMNARSN